jgi:hypothetical protein
MTLSILGVPDGVLRCLRIGDCSLVPTRVDELSYSCSYMLERTFGEKLFDDGGLKSMLSGACD